MANGKDEGMKPINLYMAWAGEFEHGEVCCACCES